MHIQIGVTNRPALTLLSDKRFTPVHGLIRAWLCNGDTVAGVLRSVLADPSAWWCWQGRMTACEARMRFTVTAHTVTGPEADAIIKEELGDDPFLALGEDGWLTDGACDEHARLESAEAFRQQVRDWDKAREEGAP